MGKRHKSTSSISTLQMMGMILLLLVAIIVMAYLLAPDKDPAPPTSTIHYEQRPEQTTPLTVTIPVEAEAMPEETVAFPQEEEKNYILTGTITDEANGEVVPDCHIQVSRTLSTAEKEALVEREREAIKNQESDVFSDILVERSLLSEDAGADVDKKGQFKLSFSIPGEYTIRVRSNEYIQYVETRALFIDKTTEDIAIQLSQGASIEGRITETGTDKGVYDLRVETAGKNYQAHHRATSDREGYYRITGLTTAEYDVSVQLSRTAYSIGDAIPFQKVTINSPKEHIKGVNFEVKAAGIVWGYVVTPEKEAIKGADLVLCSSASILSQATKAIMDQAPPIHDSADESGYYELIGVPLNKEWRVYATSDDHSPQLADPFILTDSMREARVDIYLFSGTSVYGRVVTSSGDPVPQAEVMCMPELLTFTRPLDTPPAFREDKTDEDGYFEILQLPAGNYQMRAHKQSYKLSLQGLPIYANGYNDINNLRVVLDPVSEGEYTVFGTVLDATRTPIQGAKVEIGGLGTESFAEVSMDTTTDQNGQFLFTGIELGMYMLNASAEGFGEATISRVLLDKENEVVLKATAIIRGQVLVKDTRQVPESQASVNAVSVFLTEGGSSLNMMDFAQGGAHTTADPVTGRFELLVKDGDYRLEATAAGYTRGRTEVSLQPGEVMENVMIYVLTGGGVISGRVITADGKSPQGTEVTLVEGANAAMATFVLTAARAEGGNSMRVGQDGLFIFEDLPEGSYTLYAQHIKYAGADSGIINLAAEGYESNIILRLGAGGTLEGYVFKNGEAQEGAVVMLTGNGVTEMANTDGRGFYQVEEASAGVYQAVVVSMGAGGLPGLGGGTQGIQVEIQEGRVTVHNFGEGTGVRLTGSCQPGPQTLAGGVVVLRTPGVQPYGLGSMVSFDQLFGFTTPIDQGGSFSLEDVPPGSWQLDVYYVEIGGARYVHTEMVTIDNDASDVHIPMNITFQ